MERSSCADCFSSVENFASGSANCPAVKPQASTAFFCPSGHSVRCYRFGADRQIYCRRCGLAKRDKPKAAQVCACSARAEIDWSRSEQWETGKRFTVFATFRFHEEEVVVVLANSWRLFDLIRFASSIRCQASGVSVRCQIMPPAFRDCCKAPPPILARHILAGGGYLNLATKMLRLTLCSCFGLWCNRRTLC
jgi:hypothetical protein